MGGKMKEERKIKRETKRNITHVEDSERGEDRKERKMKKQKKRRRKAERGRLIIIGK